MKTQGKRTQAKVLKVYLSMIAQGINHTEKESHQVDIEQIALTFAVCNPEGSANKCILSMLNETSRMEWQVISYFVYGVCIRAHSLP